MTQHTERHLSFDGKGINETDEFRTRIATFADHVTAEKYGNLFAAAPRLLEALERLLEWDDAGCDPSPKVKQMARATLAAAKGEG